MEFFFGDPKTTPTPRGPQKIPDRSRSIPIDPDPKKDPKATRYQTLKFNEVLEKRLAVMDLTAMTMCMEHDLPVQVFDFRVPGNVARAVQGEAIGTLVRNG